MESSTKNLLFGLLLIVFVSVVHGNGFSVNLINRDYSPLSPSYNQSQTPFERLKNAIARSTHRVNSFIKPSLSSDSTIRSSVAAAGPGAYIMKYSVGTPPRELLGIADTGSDLTWTQCKPCVQCFGQTGPIFDSEESSSYEESCDSRPCVDLGSTSCSANKCTYSYGYGDGSHTNGNVASETFTFDTTSGRSVQIPKVSFGCGHENAGIFDGGSSGIVGLGAGPLSLASQLGSMFDGKFSYCLIPSTSESPVKTSTLNFGSAAELTGDDVVSTPFVRKSDTTFYYLTLIGITVVRGNDSTRVDFKQSKSVNLAAEGDTEEEPEGNIIIDSGAMLTYVSEDFYQRLEDKVKSVIDGEIVASSVSAFRLCYKAKEDLKLPNFTVHFWGVADLELEPVNLFVQTEDGVCFIFTTGKDINLYGNIAQVNFLVEYDVKNAVVKFKKTDCTQH